MERLLLKNIGLLVVDNWRLDDFIARLEMRLRDISAAAVEIRCDLLSVINAMALLLRE